MNGFRVAFLMFLAVFLAGCGSSPQGDLQACEEFQSLMNRASLLDEDLILYGEKYSEDLKYEVIPLAGEDLSKVFLKMLSVMEQTNQGTDTEIFTDLKEAIQVIADSCSAQGVDFSK
jgi:hypothetical protein